MENTEHHEPSDVSSAGKVPRFGNQQWIPYVLPLLVFMSAANLEPKAPESSNQVMTPPGESIATEDTPAGGGFVAFESYPLMYAVRIGLTLIAIGIAWRMYRTFPFRISGWSIACGVVGIIVWVGLCHLDLEDKVIPASARKWLGGERAGFNPYVELGDRPAVMISFIAVRLFGLALVVPLIEEFLLRGFVVRFLEGANWWTLPVGSTAAMCWVAVIVYAAATHPGEMFAAIVWFSLVTAIVGYTKNIWDAVAAHAVTNLLLGIYVLSTEKNWELW